MKRFVIEEIHSNNLVTTYRVVPAFMEPGYRVIIHHEWERDSHCGETIYKSEDEALKRYMYTLSQKLRFGYIKSVTLTVEEV